MALAISKTPIQESECGHYEVKGICNSTIIESSSHLMYHGHVVVIKDALMIKKAQAIQISPS